MKVQQKTTIESIIEELRPLLNQTKTLRGYNHQPGIVTMVSAFAQHMQKGEDKDALAVGGELVEKLRGNLTAFLRFSVVDRPEKPAYFTKAIGDRKEKGYGPDLVGRLEKLRREFEEAIRFETNGTFERRINARNALFLAVGEADVEHKRRQDKREQKLAAEKKAEEERRDAETRERNRAVAEAQREEHLAKRKAAAEEILGLL